MKTLRIAMAQTNPVLGDIAGNRDMILSAIDGAAAREADIIAFPELVLTGYPPEDLVLRADFVEANRAALREIASKTLGKDILVLLGFVDRTEGTIHNAAAAILGGEVKDVYHKFRLPNYGVFDEKRYFEPGKRFPVYTFRGCRIGVNICEDIWDPRGPALYQAGTGKAQVIVNLSSSPYHVQKWKQRERMLASRAKECGTYLVYVNCVGGQDELVFDGNSMVFDPEGVLVARAALFEERLALVDVEAHKASPIKKRAEAPAEVEPIYLDDSETRDRKDRIRSMEDPPESVEAEVWKALVTGTRDYVLKNGFREVIVGLSGGIDSAVVAAVAADALGSDNVMCLFMPSQYTSNLSRTDASNLAENLGVRLDAVPIDGMFRRYLDGLSDAFEGTSQGIAEENIQARIRGNLLMAYSNKFGHLVLTTGNKSEYSTGYSTLYGDMSGGYAVLMDVLKTAVYRLAEFRNREKPVIPESILRKAPTAELKPDQTDQDTLPPYEILDGILKMYVEEDASPDEIVSAGHDPDVVDKVIRMVDAAEYKRRQAPPGLKITERAFGRDRRMPITNRFRA